MKKQHVKRTGPVCTTTGRITIDQTDPSGTTYRGSCNICGWVSRRKRIDKDAARGDVRRHERADCSQPVKWARRLVIVPVPSPMTEVDEETLQGLTEDFYEYLDGKYAR